MESSSVESAEERWFATLLIAAVGLLWVAPVGSSFWLDETGTYWVVKDGLASALSRSISWPGQSQLYSLIAWAALAIGGPHEIALRLPSLIAMAAAAFLLYRLAERLFHRGAARIACLVFVCSEPVAFAAADARPYALAVFAVLGSALLLVRWLDTGRGAFAVGYAAASAVAIHAHYLVASALIAHALYGLSRARKDGRRLSVLIGAWLAAALFTAPAVVKLAGLYQNRTSHSFAGVPAFSDLLAAIAPPTLVGSIALGFLLAWLFSAGQTSLKAGLPPPSEEGRGGSAQGDALRLSLLLTVGWALAPPLFCYVVSVKTSTAIFVPRYYIASVPALALLAGYLIQAHAAAAARRVVVAVVFVAAVLSFGTLQHEGEDWRGAISAVSAKAGADTPVLMASGFVEASDPQALNDPQLRDALFAPLAAYPNHIKLVRLPFRFDSQYQAYVEQALAGVLEHQDRFIFVARWQGLSFEPWLRGRLAARGFQSQSLGNFGKVGAYLFSAAPQP